MSRFTDTLKAPAAPCRAVPATRQGRTHVGVYVLPDVAHRPPRAGRGRIHQHAGAH